MTDKIFQSLVRVYVQSGVVTPFLGPPTEDPGQVPEVGRWVFEQLATLGLQNLRRCLGGSWRETAQVFWQHLVGESLPWEAIPLPEKVLWEALVRHLAHFGTVPEEAPRRTPLWGTVTDEVLDEELPVFEDMTLQWLQKQLQQLCPTVSTNVCPAN